MDLGGFGPLVPVPESDHRPVDADLHEIHGGYKERLTKR